MVRISGPAAGTALSALVARPVPPRTPALRTLRDPRTGEALDRALCLLFPGPGSATGEDLAELHLHGGRAVVDAVLDALGVCPGLRTAEPGEFTQRAFRSGRLDLTEVEGLADLLSAETQAQRRQALHIAEGGLAREVERWRVRILDFAAEIEAAVDYDDEYETVLDEDMLRRRIAAAAVELQQLLENPPAERLRDGIRVVIAGPPNAGKSTLLNALAGRDAAIVSDIPGTTRDRIEVPLLLDGVAFLLTDTAGLRATEDAIERVGVARAEAAMQTADICLWLGPAAQAPANAIRVHAQVDRVPMDADADLAISTVEGIGMADLRQRLVARAVDLLPSPGALALGARHRRLLGQCTDALAAAALQRDLLMAAEDIRTALSALDHLTGRAGTDDMLSALFGRFCLGK